MCIFYRSLFQMAIAPGISKIEFTAAHEEITFRIGADVSTLLIDQPGVANRAVVPPISLGFGFRRA
jgi:hypothetical protein